MAQPLEPMHGSAIAQRIRQMSNEQLRVRQSALYPALHKLEQQGWIGPLCGSEREFCTRFAEPHSGGAHSAPARERSGAKGPPRATEPGSGAEPRSG
jgi:hypothetical protein